MENYFSTIFIIILSLTIFLIIINQLFSFNSFLILLLFLYLNLFVIYDYILKRRQIIENLKVRNRKKIRLVW
jgi:4-hydroxybenzoate polyprenyltransferase